MDVPLLPELHAKLARLSQKRGVAPEQLVREAIERLINHDDWFGREVEKDLAQVDTGQTLMHENVAHVWANTWRANADLAIEIQIEQQRAGRAVESNGNAG